MIVVVAMLLLMILTRWSYISHTAAEAFKRRFVPVEEHVDTPSTYDSGHAQEQ